MVAPKTRCVFLLAQAIAVGILDPSAWGVRTLAWAALPHVGIACLSLVLAVMEHPCPAGEQQWPCALGMRDYRGLGEQLLHPIPDPFAAPASWGAGRGSASLALGTSSRGVLQGRGMEHDQSGNRKDRNCFSYVAGNVSVCVVSSDKRNNLERYRLSELYEGACGEMIISLPFLLFLNFIIQVFVLIHSLLF